MVGKIYTILLAAGLSERFGGENKLLAPFRGRPLARWTVDLVQGIDCCFERIFFVYSDEKVAALAKNAPITLIRNSAPRNGQGESVRLGAEAAPACDDDYLFFFPCDQPFLDADTVRLLLAVRRPGCIVEPCYKTPGGAATGGSPSLFSGVYRGELMSLKEGEAPRAIKARHSHALIRVTVSNPLTLADIDDRALLDRLNQ
jgi:molybdenum cofactor cytidylyltransferase